MYRLFCFFKLFLLVGKGLSSTLSAPSRYYSQQFSLCLSLFISKLTWTSSLRNLWCVSLRSRVVSPAWYLAQLTPASEHGEMDSYIWVSQVFIPARSWGVCKCDYAQTANGDKGTVTQLVNTLKIQSSMA